MLNSPLSSHLIPIIEYPNRNPMCQVPNVNNHEIRYKSIQLPVILHNGINEIQHKKQQQSANQILKRNEFINDQIVPRTNFNI